MHDDVTVRDADLYDIPLMKKVMRQKFPDWEKVDFAKAHSMIVEHNGVPFGMISARLVWQLEPMLIFDPDPPQHAKRRGVYLLYTEMEKWLSKPENNHGVLTMLCRVITKNVLTWGTKMGMHRMFQGGFLAAKDLGC